MIGDFYRNRMHFKILGFLIVFAVLKLKHAQVPILSEVTVKCDSFGVVVEWTADGLSQEAEFVLEIKSNFGQNIPVLTKYSRYNITALLKDPTHNLYLVKVKVRDREQESEFVKSKSFSYDTLMKANITCGLEFPSVTLFPKDGMLFVQFVNPLHLYNNTPALRNLTTSDTLLYCFNCDKLPQEFTCDVKSQMCIQNISFPNKQTEYCVNLMGKVRQTIIRQTVTSCYSGPLYPALPVTTYLIPLLLAFGVFVILALASVFLVKKVKRIIKKKDLSKLPKCLNKMSFTPLITLLKPEQEIVGMDPRVEPDITLGLGTMHDPQEITAQAETMHSAVSSNHSTKDEESGERSKSGDYQSSWNTYGNAADLSSNNIFGNYDCSHWRPE